MESILIFIIFISLVFLTLCIAYICSSYIQGRKDKKQLTPKEIQEQLPGRITFFDVNKQKWQTLNWSHRTMHIHANEFVVAPAYPYPYTCSMWWLIFETDKNVYCLLFLGDLPNKSQLEDLIPFRVYKLSQSKINRNSYIQIIDKMTNDDDEIEMLFRFKSHFLIRSMLTKFFRHELKVDRTTV